MDDLSRPHVIAAVVGVAAMTFTVVLGYLTAQAFLLGGQEICPEGLCGLWMLLGLWGAGPALLICGVSGGLAAQRAANGHRASKSLMWRRAILAATIAWSVSAALGLTWFYLETGNLPPGPENLFRALGG